MTNFSKSKEKHMDFVPETNYTNSIGSLACRGKEVISMTGQPYITIQGSLHIEHGTYIVRARVPDPKTGKRSQRSKSTGFKAKNNTKRKAELAMREILAQWEREANRVVYEDDPLFSEYVQKFLDRSAMEHRENTTCTYTGYAKTYILPTLGNIKVREIKRQHIQSFYDDLFEKGKSANSIRKYAVIISGALHLAVLDEIIPYNIAKDGSIKVPKAKRYRGEVYDKVEAQTLLKIANEEPEPMRSAIILALCYGLRREETCGLRWCDIDFDKKEMFICNTVTQNGGKVFRDNDTKTEKSRRYLTLVESTIPYLKELKATQKKRGLKLDKVCRWPDGKEVQPGYITHAFPKVLKRHGLKHIRYHDLRGTAASLMAQSSTPKQLQEFMGHNKIATTMEIYVKAFDDDRKAVAGFMNSILENSPFCSEKCSD